MKINIVSSHLSLHLSHHLSRRDLLKALGLTAGAVIAGPTLAACTPAVAPVAARPQRQKQVVRSKWNCGPLSTPMPAGTNRWRRIIRKRSTPHFDLTVTEIAYSDMHDKLQIALQTGGVGVPDISDIEQGRFGGFLRGADPGLVDLKDRLTEGGLSGEISGGARGALQLSGSYLRR